MANQAALKKELQRLLRLPENDRCADCKIKSPTWASKNLGESDCDVCLHNETSPSGIFLCLNCAGCHRSMGTHISQVRSVTLDSWEPQWVQTMASVGNVKFNSYFEARLTPDRAINPSVGENRRNEFIREKYESKTYHGQPSAAAAAPAAASDDPFAGKTPQEIRRLQRLAAAKSGAAGVESPTASAGSPQAAPTPAAAPAAAKPAPVTAAVSPPPADNSPLFAYPGMPKPAPAPAPVASSSLANGATSGAASFSAAKQLDDGKTDKERAMEARRLARQKLAAQAASPWVKPGETHTPASSPNTQPSLMPSDPSPLMSASPAPVSAPMATPSPSFDFLNSTAMDDSVLRGGISVGSANSGGGGDEGSDMFAGMDVDSNPSSASNHSGSGSLSAQLGTHAAPLARSISSPFSFMEPEPVTAGRSASVPAHVHVQTFGVGGGGGGGLGGGFDFIDASPPLPVTPSPSLTEFGQSQLLRGQHQQHFQAPQQQRQSSFNGFNLNDSPPMHGMNGHARGGGGGAVDFFAAAAAASSPKQAAGGAGAGGGDDPFAGLSGSNSGHDMAAPEPSLDASFYEQQAAIAAAKEQKAGQAQTPGGRPRALSGSKSCAVNGCEHPRISRGYCKLHIHFATGGPAPAAAAPAPIQTSFFQQQSAAVTPSAASNAFGSFGVGFNHMSLPAAKPALTPSPSLASASTGFDFMGGGGSPAAAAAANSHVHMHNDLFSSSGSSSFAPQSSPQSGSGMSGLSGSASRSPLAAQQSSAMSMSAFVSPPSAAAADPSGDESDMFASLSVSDGQATSSAPAATIAGSASGAAPVRSEVNEFESSAFEFL